MSNHDARGFDFSAQHDFDNTPFPTDVMWPETRMAMARVLGQRGEGFIALSMGLTPPSEWEALAEASGAPILWQAVVPAGDELGKARARARNAA